jgi:phosphatidylserine/phosphatidylglycerophosphate/cardiolipin synthase-like enzyme
MKRFGNAFISILLFATALNLSPTWVNASAARGVQTRTVLISALHYYGFDSSNDEAVELINVSDAPITLDNFLTLRDASDRIWLVPTYTLSAGQRVWIANDAVAFSQQFGFLPALTYSGALGFANHGGSVVLERTSPDLRDEITMSSGWAAGSGSPTYRSMERIDAGAPPLPANWASAAPAIPIAFDGGGQPITGTPRAANSVAVAPTFPSTYTVVINEVAWGGTRSYATREWIELRNLTNLPFSLAGWRLSVGSGTVILSGTIAANDYFLVSNNAGTFSSGAVIDQVSSFSLSNSGSTLRLIDTRAEVVDTLIYGDGVLQTGWVGAPVQPYTVTQTIPDDGQVLMRRIDAATRLPATDTDTALDWVNTRGDPLDGQKPIYPGWRVADFIAPATGQGALSMAIAPDVSFDFVVNALSSATASIDLESFTFENARIGEVLAAKAASGVVVRVLLDGAPVGGLKDQTRWICQQITQADVSGRSGCWFVRSDSANKVHTRYAYMHAKFILLDNARVLVGSENFGPRGMPFDDKSDGTAGQRGVIALTDAPDIVARVRAVFDADLDLTQRDLVRWCAVCGTYGAPPPTYTVNYDSGGISYTVRLVPMSASTAVSMTLYSSPESNLSSRGLIATLNMADAGDEVLVEQLDEPHYWGASSSDPASNPNPRIQAIIGAASRGAMVRVLLDAYYDDPIATRSNSATAQYLNALAATNGWNLQAKLGNPTGLGIHNKMFLVRAGSRHFAHIGSWNGTEVSAKRNREASLLIESSEAHAYLRDMFQRDWQLSNPVYAPLIARDFQPPTHLLISEVMVNPAGADETGREWVELYNPTTVPIDLTGMKIGDAVNKGSTGEGMFLFPDGAAIPAGKAIVVAQNAAAYFADWGMKPDYELSDYDPTVPQITPYTTWATGEMELSNLGDEIVLLANDDTILDSAVWLSGVVPGTLPYTATVTPGHTLQRWPPSVDTDSCAVDFRDQAVPSPGKVP